MISIRIIVSSTCFQTPGREWIIFTYIGFFLHLWGNQHISSKKKKKSTIEFTVEIKNKNEMYTLYKHHVVDRVQKEYQISWFENNMFFFYLDVQFKRIGLQSRVSGLQWNGHNIV